MSEGMPLAALGVSFDFSDVDAATAAYERNIAAGVRMAEAAGMVTASGGRIQVTSSAAASASRDLAAQATAASAALVREAQQATGAASAAAQLAAGTIQAAGAFGRGAAGGGALASTLGAVNSALSATSASALGASSALRDMAGQVMAVDTALAAEAQAASRAAGATKQAAVAFTDFYETAQRDFSVQYVQAAQAAVKHTDGLVAAHGRGVASSKAMTQATLNLSRQLADVGVTAAMGMNPLMILIQQGPQIADGFQMAASQGLGFKAVMGGLAANITPLTVGFGLAGTAALALGAAFLAGQADANQFANAMKATGDYAGLTGLQFEDAVGRIAAKSNTGFGEARAAMQGLAASGQFTGQTVELLAGSVVDLAQKTGRSSADMAGYFAGMGNDVAAFAVKFNSSYHQLTAAQIEHIRLLQEQGDVTGAQLALATALHERLGREGPANLGYLEVAWKTLGGAIGDAWNALKGFGNESLRPSRQLTDARARLAVLEGGAAANPRAPVNQRLLEQTRAEVASLEAVQRAAEAKARSESAAAQVTERATEAQGRMNGQWASGADSLTKYQADLRKYEADLKALSAAGLKMPTADEQAAQRAAIYRRDMPQAAAAAQRAQTASESAARAAGRHAEELAREAEATIQTTSATLALARAYGVSDAAALAAAARVEAVGKAIKAKGDVDAYVQRQLDLNAAKAAAQGAKEVSGIQFQINARSRLYEAVAAGSMTITQANDQLALETRLRPLEAARAVASGEAKVALTKIIRDLTEATAGYNAEARRDALILANGQQEDQIALLATQLDLIGANNAARAVEIAQLQARQALIANGGDPTSPEGRKNIEHAGKIAGMSSDVTAAQDNYNASLNATLEMLTQIEAMSASVGSGLASAFGEAGRAVGDLTTALVSNARTQEQLDRDRQEAIKKAQVSQFASAEVQRKSAEQIGRIEAAYAEQSAMARVHGYGDMAEAAKGFFKENSRGYKALEAAEKVYRAFELAMSLKSMVTKMAHRTAETGASIAAKSAEVAAEGAAEGAKTAITAAGTAARTPMKVAEGAASMFAALGPLGFAAVGAMLAVMAGLGASSKGGGGSAYSLKDIQKAQGTGSVLGDPTARSESISKAMETVAANTNRDLEYSNGMLKALRSIDDQISAMTDAVVKSLGVGGALSTTDLNLGKSVKDPSTLRKITTPIAALMPSLFAKTTTRTLLDQGISFDNQTVGQVVNHGVQGGTYQSVGTETKKKFFGITYSDKTTTATTTAALEADLQRQISLLVGSLRQGVLSAAGVLGITGADKVLDAFTLEIGKISLKDMSAQEIQDTLDAVFSKVGDDMAAAATSGLAAFQKAGEGLFETLNRVARDYQVVDTSLTSIGMTFGAVGLASVQARERLVSLTGGIDALAEGASFFSDNFLSEVERMAPIQNAVAAEMKRLGLESVATKDQFKKLVTGLDLSTAAGAEMFAALMAVAPAFAKVADYMADTAKAANEQAKAALSAANDNLDKARSDLVSAYEREATAIQATISTFKDLAKSLTKFRQSLYSGPAAMLSPEEAYNAAKSQFEQTRAKALGGDKEAIADLQSVSEAYLNASKDYYASSKGYFADLEAVRQAVTSTERFAQTQVDQAEAQLTALTTQVSLLVELNKSVLSVKDAIGALATAQDAYAAAVAASMAATAVTVPPVLPTPTAPTTVVNQVVTVPPTNSGTTPATPAAPTMPGIVWPDIGLPDLLGSEIVWPDLKIPNLSTPANDLFVSQAPARPAQAPPAPMFRSFPQVPARRDSGPGNAEVVALLRDVRDELRADKVQRGAAATATIEALDGVKVEVGGVRRAIRVSAP